MQALRKSEEVAGKGMSTEEGTRLLADAKRALMLAKWVHEGEVEVLAAASSDTSHTPRRTPPSA
jgi:hypothetical protein